jgi:hypothetical protein
MTEAFELLAKLSRYDTPTICNTIELFDVRPHTEGYMDGRIRAAFPDLAPMVGFATTGTFRSAWPAEKSGAYASLEKQLRQMESLPGPAGCLDPRNSYPSIGNIDSVTCDRNPCLCQFATSIVNADYSVS